MAWYRNYYKCARCDHQWRDEWSCMCDDDCRRCGARHMSPYDADDLTTIIEQQRTEFIVLRSPKTAGHNADYRELGRFASHKKAAAFLESCD